MTQADGEDLVNRGAGDIRRFAAKLQTQRQIYFAAMAFIRSVTPQFLRKLSNTSSPSVLPVPAKDGGAESLEGDELGLDQVDGEDMFNQGGGNIGDEILAADEAFSGLSYDKGMIRCIPELLGSVAKDLEKGVWSTQAATKKRGGRDASGRASGGRGKTEKQ